MTIFAALAAVQGQVVLNPTPTRVIGQDSLTLTGYSPNLVEGRELSNPQGVALDTSVTPPHLYVSDTGNNRVLGWANAQAFANGQKADIVLGQTDLVTTFAQGPNRGTGTRSTGVTAPVGIAVDTKGNVYVVDAGNSRVLRFPTPFAQASQFPDIVIGQTGFTTNAPNSGGISASTLSFTPNGNPVAAYLAFDASGNLFVADAGNNRVLRYPAGSLTSGASGIAADLVIGQTDFVTGTVTNFSASSVSQLAEPTGIAFDTKGNLFVGESNGAVHGRVLVYSSLLSTGVPATRIVGGPTTVTSPINASQLGLAPGGIFVVGDSLGVPDASNNRILLYAPVAQWTTDLSTQPAASVIGQADFLSAKANAGQPEASATSVSAPSNAFFFGTELYVADAANNRMVVLPQSAATFAAATRVLGQDALNLSAVNLIEGKEFRFTVGNSGDAGMAVDLSSTPPHLYVADTYNNRVLCYKDLHAAKAGSKADFVIGQPDFTRSLVNYPANDPAKPNQSGLFGPIGLAVDGSGNLYVADSGNGRVLRFPAPFANPANLPNADIVMGQSSFTQVIRDPSPSTMSTPYGLAFATDNGLLVSDVALNRVLFFTGHAADFKTGQAATLVFGQPDFTTTTLGNTNDKLNSPHHIATDVDDRLYVADSGNARVSIFDRVTAATFDAQAAITLGGLNLPHAVYVNHTTGEIWVGDTGSSRAYRFPSFDNLPLNNNAPNLTLSEVSPLAITQDSSGALYVADFGNRIVIHFAALTGVNAANYLPTACSACSLSSNNRALAPGTIVAIFSLSGQTNPFGTATQNFDSLPNPLPVPTTLADTQVTVNDVPAPVFFVSPGQVNFLMPNGAPSSGTVTVQVIRASTGQVLGASLLPMATGAPGLFTLTANGSGQVAAINQDGTLNGPSNAAPIGSVVAFYGTGAGTVTGAPADGAVAVGQTSTATVPRVVIGTGYVPDANIQYSGLAPGLVGVWQVNVKVPDGVLPTTATNLTPVFFLYNSIPSGGPTLGRPTTMWVKSK